MASNNQTLNFSGISQRWLALQQRDSAANSAFFYGVDSTRIFCRPNCPGRLARRANIAFFDDIRAAQDAGYRPCQRCEPCNEQWRVDHQSRITFQRASGLITKAVLEGTQWKVGSIATEVGTSSGHLHRLFKRFANTTPCLFAEAARRAVPASRSEPSGTLCGPSMSSDTSVTLDDPQDSESVLQLEPGFLWMESTLEKDSDNLELTSSPVNWDVDMDTTLGIISHMHSNMAWNEPGIGETYTEFDPNLKDAIEENYVFWSMDWSQEMGPFTSIIES